ncbi:MAG: hypothetical protein P9M15_00525 [Candidatus Electryoneaceae bacterium]|nr:hypothetical protein [Candidatus Electryoneaceae bacterium]
MKVRAVVIVSLMAAMVLGLFGGPEAIIRQPANQIELDVGFDIEQHRIDGVARLTLSHKGHKMIGFLLNKDFTVNQVSLAGVPVEMASSPFEPSDVSLNYGMFGEWDSEQAVLWKAQLPKPAQKAARRAKKLVVEVHYTGTLYAPPDDRQFSRESIAFEVNGTIGTEGIYLSPSSFWYPMLPDHPIPHVVTASLPEGWNCVTTGMPSEPVVVDGQTVVTHTSETVTDGICFSAGQFEVQQVEYNGVRLMTYFQPEQIDLSQGYLDACRRYVDMYGQLLGEYPFEKFAVVDNFMPSGYGMPAWTLLGSEVLRLPFIKNISLGHEYLHNWFGNSLFVDYRGGNWCEGLTVYMADYRYRELQDSVSAVLYRRGLLRDYASYVTPENDYPLTEFISRSNSADRAIGYGKAMMVFHMLREMCDLQDAASPHQDSTFVRVLREVYRENQWQAITWETWRQKFEPYIQGVDLEWYFQQWVKQTGAPKISIDNMEVSDHPVYVEWNARFEVLTEPPAEQQPYRYYLPIHAVFSREGEEENSTVLGNMEMLVFIERPLQLVSINGPGELVSIHVDPAFSVFRHLYPEETPLTLSKFIGDEDGLLVVPSNGPRVEQWRAVAEGLKSDGQQVITDAEWQQRFTNRSVWLFGSINENTVWMDILSQSGNYRLR